MVALAACAPTGPTVRPADGALDRAAIEALERRGAFSEAAEAWERLARQQDEAKTDHLLRAVGAWIRAGQPDRAVFLMPDIEPLDDIQDNERRLLEAELAWLTNDLTGVSLHLEQLGDRLTARQTSRRAALERGLAELIGSPSQQALDALREAQQRGQLNGELALALLIEQPLARLEQLFQQVGHEPALQPWLDLGLTARTHLLDPEMLEIALAEWSSRHPATGFSASEANDWLNLWRQTQASPQRIAVLLPGRAELSPVRDSVSQGLMAAWFDLIPRLRPELRFFLVGDQPDDAVQAWQDAVAWGADLIIGPIERDQVDQVSQIMNPAVPTLLLNHPSFTDWPRRVESGMTAFGLLPEEEAEVAAVHARLLGHDTALVIYQDTDWGLRVGQAFRQQFERAGGRILDSARYDPRQVDHSTLLEALLELDQSARRTRQLGQVLGRPLHSEPQRRTDADLIFLAARSGDALQIRPQLRFFGAGDVPVMSTSLAIAGAPNATRDEDLDGVMLPLPPWFRDDHAAGGRRLVAERQYPALANANLSRLHALGMDALEIARWQALLDSDPDLYLPGVTGTIRSVPGHRQIERDLGLFVIRQGRAIPVQ